MSGLMDLLEELQTAAIEALNELDAPKVQISTSYERLVSAIDACDVPLNLSLGGMFAVLSAVTDERARQEAKGAKKRSEGQDWITCADPSMGHLDKLAVLAEEFGEVAHELTEAIAEKRDPGDNLRYELIQVAAVAVAWAESLE